MDKRYPTTTQANLIFLLISISILIGSSLLTPKLGIGTNLWINEYVWILAPTILLVKLRKMPMKEVLKLQKTSRRNIVIGMMAAIGMWFFAFYLSKLSGMLLDSKIGAFNTGLPGSTSVNQSILILIGMLILAPICEELLFRGVIQSAFEHHNKKYGFIMAGILFGMFHVLNGMTEVIPTLLTGLMLGYMVYRTGTIAVSMFAHFAFNASSVFINGALGLSFLKTIPMWLHVLCISAVIVSIFLIRRMEPVKSEEEVTMDIKSEKITKYNRSTVILFALSVLFVILIGSIELYDRLKL